MKRLLVEVCIFVIGLILFYVLSLFRLPDEVGTLLFFLCIFSLWGVIIEIVRIIYKAIKNRKSR